MAKGPKRGFIPPQPAAALSGLDFAHASEAYRRALEVPASTPGASDLLDQCADRLIVIPTTNLLQIAEKVSALAYRSRACAVPLSDRAAQLRIIENGTDEQQRLLSIYLDLTAVGSPFSPEWDRAVARYEAANAQVETCYASDDEDEPAHVRAEFAAARSAMLNLRAPSAKALAHKIALLIESQFTEWEGDTPDNPDTLSRMLAEVGPEPFVAAIYQDALALAGETGPLVNAKPDPFDPGTWLAEIEAATGTRTVVQGYETFITAGRGGADLPGATAAYDALIPAHREKVSRFLTVNRYEPPAAPAPTPPTPPEELRALLLNGYLNTFPEGERDAIRAMLGAGA